MKSKKFFRAISFVVSLTAILFFFSEEALCRPMRDSKSIREFKREVPCPVTNKRRGACPGYVIDHVIPLCAKGKDHHSNMQWQTIADAKKKDVDEWRQCAALRRSK